MQSELETFVLGEEDCHSDEIKNLLNQIHYLGMELSRHNPSEWNDFITACLLGGNN